MKYVLVLFLFFQSTILSAGLGYTLYGRLTKYDSKYAIIDTVQNRYKVKISEIARGSWEIYKKSKMPTRFFIRLDAVVSVKKQSAKIAKKIDSTHANYR